MKYELTRNIEGWGKAGDVVELSDEEFSKFPKNVSLKLIDEDVVGKRIVKNDEVRKAKEELVDELVNKVGFSLKRATKVADKFPDRDSLLGSLKNLPFEKVENETILEFYGKQKKQKKEAKK